MKNLNMKILMAATIVSLFAGCRSAVETPVWSARIIDSSSGEVIGSYPQGAEFEKSCSNSVIAVYNDTKGNRVRSEFIGENLIVVVTETGNRSAPIFKLR